MQTRSEYQSMTIWHKGGRILLVEDNEINQALAKEMLEGFGLSVDVANHGGEGCQMSGAAKYPDFDGYIYVGDGWH